MSKKFETTMSKRVVVYGPLYLQPGKCTSWISLQEEWYWYTGQAYIIFPIGTEYAGANLSLEAKRIHLDIYLLDPLFSSSLVFPLRWWISFTSKFLLLCCLQFFINFDLVRFLLRLLNWVTPCWCICYSLYFVKLAGSWSNSIIKVRAIVLFVLISIDCKPLKIF